MAVVAKPMESVLKVITNITKDGKTTTVTKSYGKVRSDVEDSAVYAVGAAIASLQINPLNRIVRVAQDELSESV